MSDYCVKHCVCPVVVVRYPDDVDGTSGPGEANAAAEDVLHPVPEEDHEYNDDASDEPQGLGSLLFDFGYVS